MSIARVADVHLTLAVGGKTETVDVVGEAPVVDSSSSSTDNSLSQDMLFNLPIRPTNAATDMLNYLPGINNGSSFGTNADYANGLLIDGVDTRDPEAGSSWVFFNYNLMEEVQVGGLGANAEYGSYTGAVVNTHHEVGRQPLHRPVRRLLDQGQLLGRQRQRREHRQERRAEGPRSGQQAARPLRTDRRPADPGQAVLLRGRAALRAEGQPERPAAGAHRGQPPLQRQAHLAAEQRTDNFTASFQWDYYNQTGRCTVSAGLCTDQAPDNLTVKQDSPEAVWGLQWTHLFGNNRTFSEVKYSGWWGYYYLDPAKTSPASYDLTSGEWSGGGLYHYYADRGRQQVNASISHFAEAFGKHDLKFGLEIERSKVHNRFGYTGGGYYYDYTELLRRGPVPALRLQLRLRRPQPPRVRLRPGLLEAHRPAHDQRRRPRRLRARQEPGARQDGLRQHELGAALRLRLRRDGRRQDRAQGHYGQYYEAVLSDQYVRAMPGYTDFIGYSWDPSGDKCMAGGNCFSESSRLPYPVYAVDPEMKHPRVDEWTAGFDRALGADLRVSVTGIYRQDENVQASVYPDARWTPTTLDERPHQPAADGLQLVEPLRLRADADADQRRRLRLQGRQRQPARHRSEPSASTRA